MKSKWLVVLASLGLVASLVACRSSTRNGVGEAVPALSKASGHVAGWDVTVTVVASMRASERTTARVDAVNSTDTTMTTASLARIEIRDSAGELVPTGSWQHSAFMSQDKGPGSTFLYNPDFTAPPPGRYTIGLPGMKDSSGRSVAATFTSVR